MLFCYSMLNLLATSSRSDSSDMITRFFLTLLFSFLTLTNIHAQSVSQTRSQLEQEIYSHTDLRKLDPPVTKLINQNKTNGLSLLTGIDRMFTVDIEGIRSEPTCRSVLNFLSLDPLVHKIRYTGGSRVQITTDLSISSVSMKELLSNHNVSANFIDQTLVLNK